MKVSALVFSRHALERMIARRIDTADVRAVVESGDTVESYPTDQPYPSALLLGTSAGRPLHVVVGYDDLTEAAYVITAYEPDAALWHPDWKTRRPR